MIYLVFFLEKILESQLSKFCHSLSHFEISYTTQEKFTLGLHVPRYTVWTTMDDFLAVRKYWKYQRCVNKKELCCGFKLNNRILESFIRTLIIYSSQFHMHIRKKSTWAVIHIGRPANLR